MTEPSNETTFLQEPLSVHTVPEEYVRKQFRRTAKGMGIALGLMGLLTAALLFANMTARDVLEMVSLELAIIGTFSFLPHYVRYRHALRLCGATRYEVWPDALVKRIEGLPPLVIPRSQFQGLVHNDRFPGSLLVRSTLGDDHDITVPAAVTDFPQLWDALAAWMPATAAPKATRARRRLSMSLSVALLVGIISILVFSHPVLASLGLIPWLVAAIEDALVTSSARHEDKWTRRAAWWFPIWGSAVFGVFLLDKWLKFYGSSLMDLLHRIW